MNSSFKRDGKGPPQQYRTPSPPRDAYEPPSPSTHPRSGVEAPPLERPFIALSHNLTTQPTNFEAEKANGWRKPSHSTPDTMDTFASIALSATLGQPSLTDRNVFAPPLCQSQYTIGDDLEPPSKRARSERLPSPGSIRSQSETASRPTTSCKNVPDDRRMEAELLLNFSQVARLSVPSTLTSYNPNASETGYSGIRQNRQQDPSSHVPGRKSHYHPRVRSTITEMPRREGVAVYDSPPPNGSAPEPSFTPLAAKRRTTEASETISNDFQCQLVKASKVAQDHVDPFNAVENGPSTTVLQQPQSLEYKSEKFPEHTNFNDVSVQETHNASFGAYSEAGADQHELGQAFNGHDGFLDETHVSYTTQKVQTSANGYWPSILATTVERSASAWKHRPVKECEESGANGQQTNLELGGRHLSDAISTKVSPAQEPATCAACKFTRNSMSAETEGESASWISCDGCKAWFHFACAGFKSEREVRAVDKYRCRQCKAVYGPTTYVRKSARAHAAIDYAGLNQGVVKTSDERPEHHYIKPIKDGTIILQPENFARMRPELVTAEYFEKGNGMKEPIVIPAEFNPRPRPPGSAEPTSSLPSGIIDPSENDEMLAEDWFAWGPECQNVPDHGQDALDMVIPPNLTVRAVAELYGPEEKVEVIDVKSQNGEGKKWNMRRWANYYENTSNKVVRNVISLEVSQSILGRLIRRPQIVRDLDLQDAVWPAELQAKGEIPRVQFYCLMSVADCFTDFHIDFGGSSVFYHILKGKKTFFFIPPKEKHLKKYEEWCMSPAQNWTFLADQTKECYRVDLSEGDTMLIPAGWIHAVWTPEDSLVIGGNFLTRLNYSMQLRVAQAEKATGVARKFRYPHFQKIQWYTAIRYLESDPVPSSVRSELQAGGVFYRQSPAYHDFNTWGENSRKGPENYHARYYSQPELEGLPDLVRYLLRTALIDSGDITEGITVETRNAVKKSIPRGFGEPLETVKSFAMWCAWKRGNESIPHWAFPDAAPEISKTDSTIKLSAAALKKLDHDATPQAPRRHSSRNQVQQPSSPSKNIEVNLEIQSHNNNNLSWDSPEPANFSASKPRADETLAPFKLSDEDLPYSTTAASTSTKKRKIGTGNTKPTPRKTACDSCRRRRRACQHKTDPHTQNATVTHSGPDHEANRRNSAIPFVAAGLAPNETSTGQDAQQQAYPDSVANRSEMDQQNLTFRDTKEKISQSLPTAEKAVQNNIVYAFMHDLAPDIEHTDNPERPHCKQTTPILEQKLSQTSLSPKESRGRSKACNDCRRSKRRCVHDENGIEDPRKIHEAGPKRRKLKHNTQDTAVSRQLQDSHMPKESDPITYLPEQNPLSIQREVQKAAPLAVMVRSDSPVNVLTNEQPSPIQGTRHEGCTEIEMLASFTQPGTKSFTPPTVPEQEMGGAHVEFRGSVEGPPFEVIPPVTATPTNSLRYDISTQLSSGRSFEQPAASSLVSPPASSHDESEQPASVAEPKLLCSGSSSRHSSRHPMQVQRFTPESGPARRDSSSSVVVGISTAETVKSPSTSPLSVQASESAQKRMKARMGSEIEADEESLKLIKALQAEDYGLRRRGRVQ
ncbi:MAG: hypothetical protein Q9216_001153 [Gyalolechia sp. 2 TL-2023]